MKLITGELVKKIQSIIIKAKHSDFSWEEVNNALYGLHKLEEVQQQPLKHAEKWEEMEATDTAIGVQK